MCSSLCTLSSEEKLSILSIFDYSASPSCADVHSGFDGYLNYYQTTIENSNLRCIKEKGEFPHLVRILKSPGATRQSSALAFRIHLEKAHLGIGTSGSECEAGDDSQFQEAKIDDAINLAVRLLLMIPTGPALGTGSCITVSGETFMEWNEGRISDLVSSKFSMHTELTERVKLEKIFNARNLERIGGIEVRWTSNLGDHLRMREDDTAVEIFHFASFLQLHQYCHIPLLDWQAKMLQSRTRPILPQAFVEETLRTLALLLPEHDQELEKWFRKQEAACQQRGTMAIDPKARECGQLKMEERQIDNFSYWHDRLVILKQAFDEAEPSDIRTWWSDRRKRVQWYTFWAAAMVLVLTVFFGLIQGIEGAMQVYYAAHGSH